MHASYSILVLPRHARILLIATVSVNYMYASEMMANNIRTGPSTNGTLPVGQTYFEEQRSLLLNKIAVVSCGNSDRVEILLSGFRVLKMCYRI